MVSVLDSGLRGLGSNPGQFIVLCSWARYSLLSQYLSPTQEYKWVLANCQGNLTKCWGVTCNGLAFSHHISHMCLRSCLGIMILLIILWIACVLHDCISCIYVCEFFCIAISAIFGQHTCLGSFIYKQCSCQKRGP